MVFQSKSGVDNNRRVQLFLIALLVLVAVGLYIKAKLDARNLPLVTGVYRSTCCGDIAIRRDTLSYKGRTTNYVLENMKFGLTGYVKANFTENELIPSPAETSISFSGADDDLALSVPVSGKDQTFKRIRSTYRR
jgi:hypothetical protein